MRRRHRIRYKLGVCCDWPVFFWRRCSKCGFDCRREWIWRALTGPFCNGMGQWRYVCLRCCPTRDDAHEFFENEEWMPSPPPPSGWSWWMRQ
jgi:hypothetical protein